MVTRLFTTAAASAGAGLIACLGLNVSGAAASTLVPQTALPGDCIPKFTVPLPVFGPAGALPRVDALAHPSLTVTMKEINQAVLPPVTIDTRTACPPGGPHLPKKITFGKTRVWAYEIADTPTGTVLGPANWPAVTVDARRFHPTTVTYVNNLPAFNRDSVAANPLLLNSDGLVQGLVTVDQTIHWADPLANTGPQNCSPLPASGPCTQPFVGPPPAVAHLHGAEVISDFDGGPQAWFTPNGITGAAYRTLGNPGPGKAIYQYPDAQEPGTLWFHDHALGATRTNVYSGMAAFYFLRDPLNEPKNLPSGAFEIEMALQDRQFDINSQLFFPDGSGADAATSNLNGTPPNPDIHPFWIPEFIGDVAIVNGAPWPSLNVEPRRYTASACWTARMRGSTGSPSVAPRCSRSGQTTTTWTHRCRSARCSSPRVSAPM